MDLVHFKLEYTVRDLTIPSETVYRFEYGGPHSIEISLRAPSSEEQALRHSASNAFCAGTSVAQPNDKVLEVFRQISRNDILRSDAEADEIRLEYTMPDGSRIRLPALSRFPESFQSFMKSISSELSDYSIRTVSVLRWRAGALGPHDPISTRGLSWSFDGQVWHRAPADGQARGSFNTPLRASAQVKEDVTKMVGAGETGPNHHDLFREAWEQRYANPRSSLVIGIAAAEWSVKHCISILVPEAEWLAINVPSPPLVRILREYLPKLPGRCLFAGQVKPPPEAVLESLRKGVSIRNQLAHAGSSSPSDKTIEEILEAVRDLLWLTDYYCGFEWALDFLRGETRAKLVAT